MDEAIKMLPRYRVPVVEKRQHTGGKRRKTHEQYVDELKIKNPNVIPMEKYIDSKTKIKHKCLLHNIIWEIAPNGALNGNGCKKCKSEKYSVKQSKGHEEYIEELKNKNPNVQVIEKYINAKTKITHCCLIHNIYWKASPNCVLQGSGCKLCKKDKICNSLTKTHEEYVEKLKEVNSNIEVTERYVDSKTKIKHHCLLHNIIWKSAPTNILQGKGCKECMKEKVAKKNKKSHEDYVKEVYLINPNIIIKEEYINSNTPILHECTLHNITWDGIPASVLASLGCPQCIKEKLGHSLHKTHEEYLEELKIRNPNAVPLEKYIGSKTPILHYYKDCGHKTKTAPIVVLRKNGYGCSLCRGLKISKSQSKSHEQFIQELLEINKNIEIQSIYVNASKKVKCKCKICQNVWSAKANHLLQGHGCPSCNESLGERNINMFLSSNNLYYIKYHKYDDLIGIGGGLLSYDFYLPNYNLLIEFQGEQHERPIDFFGGEKTFKIQQEHDRRKREYAKEHNINFLEIWYYNIDNVETILTECLNNLKLESVTTTGVA